MVYVSSNRTNKIYGAYDKVRKAHDDAKEAWKEYVSARKAYIKVLKTAGLKLKRPHLALGDSYEPFEK